MRRVGLTGRPGEPTTPKVSFPIAYLSASFPLRSETFVYREVRALRAAGWDVRTVSLNEPPERGAAEFADLEAGTLCVYGSGGAAALAAACGEALGQPLRALGTVAAAVGDGINPREALSAGAVLAAARGRAWAGRLSGLEVARFLLFPLKWQTYRFVDLKACR